MRQYRNKFYSNADHTQIRLLQPQLSLAQFSTCRW